MSKLIEDEFYLILCSVDEFLGQSVDDWMEAVGIDWNLDASFFDATQQYILKNQLDTKIRSALYELTDLPEQIKEPRYRNCDFELLFNLAFEQDSLEHSGCLFTESYDSGDEDLVSNSRLEEIRLISNWWISNQMIVMELFASIGNSLIDAAYSQNAEYLD